jgi:hypothetical protein
MCRERPRSDRKRDTAQKDEGPCVRKITAGLRFQNGFASFLSDSLQAHKTQDERKVSSQQAAV